jgi:hypothetical protein
MLPSIFSKVIRIGVWGISWVVSTVVWLTAIAAVGGIAYGVFALLGKR